MAIIVGFFFLRNYADYRLFNILTFAFCALGTFEVARALKGVISKDNFIIAVLFGAVFVPVFCFFEYFTAFNGAFACLIALGASAVYSALYSAINRNGQTGGFIARFAVNTLPYFYPSVFLLALLCANELQNGFICLLLIFAVSPCADTFAYLVGMTYNKIRKGKAKKMCPVLSPKKTWAGAIGGVVGGTVGAIVVYLIFGRSYEYSGAFNPVLLFALIGVIGSVLTEIGDLFESFIKRKVGIKDMGRIMPGHGGVMDRIDGMTFAAAFIYPLFLLL